MSLIDLLLGGSIIYLLNTVTKPNDRQEKFDVLRLRRYEGLSRETQELVRLITIRNDTVPVGSFKYKAHRYPADIDIFEQVRECCSIPTAAGAIAKKIQAIARKIKARPDLYLGDFKAGLDGRYRLDIGELHDDGTITGFDQASARRQLAGLRQQGLLSAAEFNEASRLLRGQMTPERYTEFYDFLRDRYIVRWTLDEIIQGSKLLPLNKRLSLSDALTHKSVIKLDLWAPLDGNYNEITNFFLLVAVDESGREMVMNQELGDRLETLNHDIRKYSSKEHRNSLKLAKRLWNRALWLKDQTTYKRLAPLFQSGINSLNQVAGESEVLRSMLERLDRPPMDVILRQIDGFKRRINDVYDAQFDDVPFYELIDETTGLTDRAQMVANLKDLESGLKEIVEREARNYLRRVGLDQ